MPTQVDRIAAMLRGVSLTIGDAHRLIGEINARTVIPDAEPAALLDRALKYIPAD